MLKNFDLSQFTSGEEMRIENANIENCKISGIQNKFCVLSKCNFNNVLFENSFYEVYAAFKECEFRECIFRDTFEGDDLELAVHDNIFINCEFQNISYRSFQVQSDVTNCKFINCNLAGFRAWYVLQHYDYFNGSFVPFVTLMEFDVPFESDIIMFKPGK
jgi:uncharacterized protein YjbI with pentapeptide repeats